MPKPAAWFSPLSLQVTTNFNSFLLPFSHQKRLGKLPLTAFLGINITCSFLALPAILQHATSPETAARQWKTIYDRGKRTGPPIGLAALSSFAYVAYHAANPAARRLWILAAILPVSIVPYTLLLLAPTNNALLERVRRWDKREEVSEAKEGSTKELLQAWQRLNYGRSMLPTLGVAVGMVGMALF